MIIECEFCEALVDAYVIAEHEDFTPESPPSKYSFLKCQNCHAALLAAQEDYGDGWDSPCRLYPPRENPLSHSIPSSIRNTYSEARSCFKVKAYTATTIMCRKTLETICKEHGTLEKNLVAALQAMKEKGVIESRLFEWADALRISGNEAVHDVSTIISAEDARDVLEFTNALLEYVFTFRDRFEAFKQRQLKKRALKGKPHSLAIEEPF